VQLTRWRQGESPTKAPDVVNDPALSKPTRVRVIKAFRHAGRVCELGEIVTLPWFIARDMIQINKAELMP
jgi:hypothetical protein